MLTPPPARVLRPLCDAKRKKACPPAGTPLRRQIALFAACQLFLMTGAAPVSAQVLDSASHRSLTNPQFTAQFAVARLIENLSSGDEARITSTLSEARVRSAGLRLARAYAQRVEVGVRPAPEARRSSRGDRRVRLARIYADSLKTNAGPTGDLIVTGSLRLAGDVLMTKQVRLRLSASSGRWLIVEQSGLDAFITALAVRVQSLGVAP